MNPSINSNPNVLEFNPQHIKFQYRVVYDIYKKYDYSLGCHEVFLSGAVGSAKSLLMAHIIVRHCLDFPLANVGIGRLTKPSLKTTLIDKILQQLRGMEDVYQYNKSTGNFEFANGSKITAYSWADTNIYKVRSEEFSLFAIEELSENDDGEIYNEIFMRLGRCNHVPHCILISASNPDEPDHWIYDRLIIRGQRQERDLPFGQRTIHVYYSVTSDNVFLPKSYIANLLDKLDPLMVQRMVFGKWISIRGDKIYYNYDENRNFKNEDYKILPVPIIISFDFNIAIGKPMSACLLQHDIRNDVFNFFDEAIIEGADTEELLLDMANRGLLDNRNQYIIMGDATGKARNTASKKSDYDVIRNFLSRYRTKEGSPIDFIIDVPLSNPPIRTRHNLVNGCFYSYTKKIRAFIYKQCKMLDKGFRLCKLLKGSKYLEDDSKPYQHVTTSAGYAITRVLKREQNGESTTIQL